MNARVDTAELDAGISRVRAYLRSMARDAYDCAIAVKDIYDRKLWRQRLGADGRPKYSAWSAFVPAELGMSDTWSRNLMRIAKMPRERFEAIGVAKSIVIMGAAVPAAAREELFDRAAAGESKAMLQHRIAQKRGKPSKAPEPVGRRPRDPLGPKVERATVALTKRGAVYCGEVYMGGRRLHLLVRVRDDGMGLEAEAIYG